MGLRHQPLNKLPRRARDLGEILPREVGWHLHLAPPRPPLPGPEPGDMGEARAGRRPPHWGPRPKQMKSRGVSAGLLGQYSAWHAVCTRQVYVGRRGTLCKTHRKAFLLVLAKSTRAEPWRCPGPWSTGLGLGAPGRRLVSKAKVK